MCLFRDWGVCWALSIGFELLELSTGWLVPQVREHLLFEAVCCLGVPLFFVSFRPLAAKNMKKDR